jgi:hypothetical protein
MRAISASLLRRYFLAKEVLLRSSEGVEAMVE